MNTKSNLIKALDAHKTRSAWAKGVKEYAYDLIDDFTSEEIETAANTGDLRKLLLNGASDWKEFSWGGCSLIYDADIAERLCAPWELKKTDNGRKNPNSSENWLDTQARALFQAWLLINRLL